MIYNVTAPTASLWSILQQHPLRIPAPLTTATTPSSRSILLQKQRHLTIYTVTATITSLRPHILWSILFQQPSHPYVLSCHSHSYDLMTYSIPATQPPSRPIALQPYGTNATASILRLNKLMLRPIYYAFTISGCNLYIMSLQSNNTAYISRPYNLMLQPILRSYNYMIQPIYYVLTIQRYSLYIMLLQFNDTAYMSRPPHIMLQHICYVPTI